MSFETEIQELIYNVLIGDSLLQGYLGGGVSDLRVYLDWNEDDLPECTPTEPGWIGIESLPEDAPLTEKLEVFQRVILHIYTLTSGGTTRLNIRKRLVVLFHASGGSNGIWKGQTATTTYSVKSKGGGVGIPYDYRGLLVLPYYIDIRFKPKTIGG